jgi:hypothetical protein
MAQKVEPEFKAYSVLEGSLPPSNQAGKGDDFDIRARATLAYLVEEMLALDYTKTAQIPEDPTTCPNCGTSMPSKSSPYCSPCCRKQAAFIRQMRDSIAKGTILDQDRQINKGEVLWRLLGGGLPRRLQQVPEKARQQVFKRDNNTCQSCGAPATTIDNTGSG